MEKSTVSTLEVYVYCSFLWADMIEVSTTDSLLSAQERGDMPFLNAIILDHSDPH